MIIDVAGVTDCITPENTKCIGKLRALCKSPITLGAQEFKNGETGEIRYSLAPDEVLNVAEHSMEVGSETFSVWLLQPQFEPNILIPFDAGVIRALTGASDDVEAVLSSCTADDGIFGFKWIYQCDEAVKLIGYS